MPGNNELIDSKFNTRKATSKQFLFAVSEIILLGGGVWMSHLQSQDGGNSDMLLANIEAMAKVEESTGYQTVEKITEEHQEGAVTIYCECAVTVRLYVVNSKETGTKSLSPFNR